MFVLPVSRAPVELRAPRGHDDMMIAEGAVGVHLRVEVVRRLAGLERAAPRLAGPVEGVCPSCGEKVSGWFDPGAFVLAELRTRAQTLLEEVHLLASRYGWSEEVILNLPGRRRAAYAEA